MAFGMGEWVDLRPARSASWKRNSHGMGTKTQFSAFGATPTGELGVASQVSVSTSSTKQKHLPYICTYTCANALFCPCIQGDMHSWIRCGLLLIEILYEGRICAQSMLSLSLCESLGDLFLCSSCCIPSYDVELFLTHIPSSTDEHLEHGTVVLHVDSHLLLCLGVEDRECMCHAHCRWRWSCSKKRPDYAVLLVCPTEVVIENGKERRGVDRQRCRTRSDYNFLVNASTV